MGLGKKTHQPYGNFGPQAGIVFSPGDHKLSVRAGVGIFYDSDVFNNTSNARSTTVNANGNYFNDTGVCGGIDSVDIPGQGAVSSVNGIPLATICGEPIAQSAPLINQLKAEYQAASSTGGPNPAYIGTGNGLKATSIYGAPYLTPYSIQFNGGFQREVAKGAVISVDYVHNATMKIPLTIDVNHVGAARYLNVTAAQAAIAATLAACNAATVQAAYAPGGCPGIHPGVGGAPGGPATIQDFASNGLDSGNQYSGGFAASAFGQSSPAAFSGINPNVGDGGFILPVGRSGYDAGQFVYRQQVSHPVPGIVSGNLQVSYTLSRVVGPTKAGNSADQLFAGAGPWDNDDPNKFLGRNNLDHTNELSFGGSVDVKYGVQIGLIGHFYSAFAQSLTLDNSTGGAGEIFRTDVDGDGTTGDLLPGTGPGSYMHQIKGSKLANSINSYNTNSAGKPTPAGQALINAGLMSAADLTALNGVQQPIAQLPTGGTPIQNPAFRSLDASAGYPIALGKLREGMTLVPKVAIYNVANFSNFSGLTGQLINVADNGGGAAGVTPNFLNGPNTTTVQDGLRTQRGSGTFDQGAPRTTEFQLHLNF